MDHDDQTIGHILSRRTALKLLGSGAVLLSGQQIGTAQGGNTTCVVRPAMTEGPYFVDEQLDRSDIRPDPGSGKVSEGTPLRLKFLVSKVGAGSCAPLAGAMVDIWHCDALGVYSDVVDRGSSTRGQKFLRGFQRTDANGVAQFLTIYPGWYQGRAVHIHFKIRSGGREFTSQLFFDEDLTSKIYAGQPYARKGTGWLRNARDGIYRGGGSQLLLSPTAESNGYSATFDIGMNLG
jgi:protocatechuate 3,4-dioxygenase beta subunit